MIEHYEAIGHLDEMLLLKDGEPMDANEVICSLYRLQYLDYLMAKIRPVPGLLPASQDYTGTLLEAFEAWVDY